MGAAYLIVLGIHRFLATNPTPLANFVIAEHPVQQTSRSLVVQALFALNPKTALFFLALFPQFVAKNAGPAWLQILLFGCAFVVLGFVTHSMYGCLGGTLSSFAKHSNRFNIATRYMSSAVLIGIGITSALASAPHKPV